MKQDDKVFFRMPTVDAGKKRILRPGTVLAVDEAGCKLQLEDSVAIEEGSDGFLHFEEKRKFLQQAVRVVSVDPERAGVVAVQFQGTPVSAESRQAFRVSCLGANIKARIDDEAGCDVVDLSVTGFAFYSHSPYQVGRRLRVSLQYDGKDYQGFATVQSTRSLNAKQFRYGAHCTDGAGDNLAKSLAALSLAVQSEQLRRLANG